VAPDWRGRGIAQRVIRGCIEAMRERGEPISSLYPATTRLYRTLGWELGGGVAIRKVSPGSLRGLPRPTQGRTRPLEPQDWPAVHACYQRLASAVNGCLDRSARWWERRQSQWQGRDLYVFDDAGAIEGYLVYRQIDGEHGQLGGPFTLAVDEVVAATRDAGLALWGLLASWSSQVGQIFFRGGADDPILLVLPEQVFAPLAELRWMTRVVDAQQAVAERGFPQGLDVEVPLRLRDEIVPANDGGFVLAVQKGRGRLAPVADASGPEIDVRGFSSLYTGWSGTAALERAGLLIEGTPHERAALDAAFAGMAPWMLDEF